MKCVEHKIIEYLCDDCGEPLGNHEGNPYISDGENNYCYDIKIQDIAHQIGIDRSYIYRLFIDLEHMAPKDFLMACRLKHACEMLAEGCSVVETAYSCGFVDPESFQYHFRNTYHSSPEEYLWERERHEGQPLRR